MQQNQAQRVGGEGKDKRAQRGGIWGQKSLVIFILVIYYIQTKAEDIISQLTLKWTFYFEILLRKWKRKNTYY